MKKVVCSKEFENLLFKLAIEDPLEALSLLHKARKAAEEARGHTVEIEETIKLIIRLWLSKILGSVLWTAILLLDRRFQNVQRILVGASSQGLIVNRGLRIRGIHQEIDTTFQRLR